MAAFRYEAVDASGRSRHGVLDAETARAARDRLRADGLTPTAVAPAPEAPDVLSRTRLDAAATALITRQLATLVQSGMPLDHALTAASEQADDARAAKILGVIRTQVMAGEPLPVALARFPRTFSTLYRGLVGAGTETGRLGEVLARLADYLDARLELRQKFAVALIYPALVTLVAAGVIGVLLVYVVPQVVSVYQQSRQMLPFLTRALIATSGFFRATGWYWLVALVVAAAALAWRWRFDSFRARVHAWLLRVPGAGRLAASLDCARYASTLAILVGSGTPLMRALAAASEVVRLIPIAIACRRANTLVREGVPLSRALRDQNAFPPVLVHLVANGEQSGALAPMLVRAAQELEREAERRLAWLAALIQPTLIVAMGAIVLVLVLAVMLPIVTMSQLVK